MSERILNKLTSAQFLMAIMLTWTLCWGFIAGLVTADAFLPLVGMAVTLYFRRDRPTNGGAA